MFGLDKISFLICLGVTLLLTGLIIFFMRQKFAVYDRHITEQSQLLKHLVAKLENNIHTTNAMLAAPSAIAAAKEAHRQFGQNEGHLSSNSKIIVSDDESSCDSESSDDANESDDSSSDDSEMSEIDADNLNIKCKQIKLNENNIGNSHSSEIHIVLDDVGETKTINLNTLVDLDDDDDSDMDIDSDESDDDSVENDDNNDNDETIIINDKHSGQHRAEEKITVYHTEQNESDVIEVDELNPLDETVIPLNNNRSLKQILLDDDSEIKIYNGIHKNNKKNSDNKESKDNHYLELLETNNDELNLNDMKLSQLKELCKSRNLITNGNKKELIERLTNK